MSAPRPEVGNPLARARERSLTYVDADRSLVLWTDYARKETVLERPARLSAEDLGVLGHWQTADGRPHRVPVGESVEGYGVFTFPYGPVTMGVPESGAFDLRTYGERVLELIPEVGYKHRGVAMAVVGRSAADALLRVERLAGNFSASHAAAFLGAVEAAEGIRVPESELWTRALAQELQRVYNHLRLIARVAEAASQNVGVAQAHALAEESLRLIARTFGHRWAFGAFASESPLRRLGPDDRRALGDRLREFDREFGSLWELFLSSRTFIDRIQSTATVSRADALRWGAVGPTLRASGVAWDDRLRAPTPPYTDLFVPLAQGREGDALARVMVRQEEIRSSLLLVEQMLDRWSSVHGAEFAPPRPVEAGPGDRSTGSS
ncbi:NADH dehydrogenase (ubiquinone) 30 kDa subunit [mine drainage metagenome]|uniref:NADH dehydrogenase (Ubiquinone) 30 kDa subunit n=1 Tax=mine drainage metagenome TaxID=410659 RepID=T1CSP1_9ZZZZ